MIIPSSDNKAWLHVFMVFLFMLVNYADKAVIGLSSVPIMHDLNLSSTQFGELGSAFFLLFSISGVVGGFIANRVRTKTLLWAMAMIWAVALLPMSFLSSFGLLICSRILLGAAEGPSFPIAVHAVYQWFNDRRRALPTSVVASGAAFGTGVIAPLVTWMIQHHGWHAAFGALGIAGLVWACLWMLVAEDGPGARGLAVRDNEAPTVPYRRLLASRTAIGVFLAGFGAYWLIALNITWLANYLVKNLAMTPAHAAWIVALPAVMQLVLAPCLALLSQYLIRRGLSSRVARGVLGAACVMIAGGSLTCMAFLPVGALKVFLIGLGFSIGSVIFTLGSTLIGEISPPRQRGAMLGITNSIHTLAGLCAPFAMGLMLDVASNQASGFRTGYLCAGSLVAMLGLIAALLIDPEGDLAGFREFEPRTS